MIPPSSVMLRSTSSSLEVEPKTYVPVVSSNSESHMLAPWTRAFVSLVSLMYNRLPMSPVLITLPPIQQDSREPVHLAIRREPSAPPPLQI